MYGDSRNPTRKREKEEDDAVSLSAEIKAECPAATAQEVEKWLITLSTLGLTSLEKLQYIDEEDMHTVMQAFQTDLVFCTVLRRLRRKKANMNV